jgi:hypothetical protein
MQTKAHDAWYPKHKQKEQKPPEAEKIRTLSHHRPVGPVRPITNEPYIASIFAYIFYSSEENPLSDFCFGSA